MLHLQGAHIQPSWIRVKSEVYVVIVKYLEQDLCVCREGCSNTVPVCGGEARAECKCLIYQWVYPNLWPQALGSDRKQAAESGWSLRGRVRSSVPWENSEQWSSRTRASSGTRGTTIQNLGHLVSKVFWHV